MTFPRGERETNSAPTVAVGAALFIAYVGLEWVSSIHEYKGLLVTPWNPGLGTVFAGMIAVGLWMSLALFAGVVAVEWLMLEAPADWPGILGTGAVTALCYGLVAAVARDRLRLDARLIHLRDVLVLLAAGLAGAIIVAVLLSGFLLASDRLRLDDLTQSTLPLLIGDVIGISVMAPLLLRFAFQPPTIRLPRAVAASPEGLIYLVMIAVGLWAIFGSESTVGHALFYLLFLPVVAAALRHGLDGACLSLAATQLGLIGVLHVSGFDAAAFTEFQALMFALTVTGLVVGVIVSERRNADLRYRETAAQLREKEAEVAQAMRFNLASGMASALAHEINQPMTAARACARSAQQILRMPAADLARADGFLTTMVAQIDHAAEVVRQMRDFLRRGQPKSAPVDIRAMIDDAVTLIGPQAAAQNVTLRREIADGLPPVDGDRLQLEQVMLNLIHNALEAIAGAARQDGLIVVTARHLAAPPRIEIGVQDNGPGIGDEFVDRLFAPLATSKAAGLGLGLPICVAIVESHAGRLWLQSRVAGATEFRISLPVAPGRPGDVP